MAAGARGIFSLASLVLVAGALVFMFFILFAGVYNSNPVDKFYFLQADTSSIQGAPSLSRWTYWNVCGVTNNLNSCGDVHPAFPFDPPRNFAATDGVPPQFLGTHHYYYLTRFMFAFMLIALTFTALALLTGILALCFRLVAYFSGLLTTIAWFFQALNAALMTAAYVQGRNAFRSIGQSASIGQYAFGFEWAAFACLFLATVLFCIGGSSGKSDTYTTKSKRGGFFGSRRSKSTRSRGSFIHGDKDYS